MASFLCPLCPVLGQNCNLVLLFSTHLPFFGYIFSCERKNKSNTHFQELAFGSSSLSHLNKHWPPPPTLAGSLVGWETCCVGNLASHWQWKCCSDSSHFLFLLPLFSFLYNFKLRNFLCAGSPVVYFCPYCFSILFLNYLRESCRYHSALSLNFQIFPPNKAIFIHKPQLSKSGNSTSIQY